MGGVELSAGVSDLSHVSIYFYPHGTLGSRVILFASVYTTSLSKAHMDLEVCATIATLICLPIPSLIAECIEVPVASFRLCRHPHWVR